MSRDIFILIRCMLPLSARLILRCSRCLRDARAMRSERTMPFMFAACVLLCRKTSGKEEDAMRVRSFILRERCSSRAHVLLLSDAR